MLVLTSPHCMMPLSETLELAFVGCIARLFIQKILIFGFIVFLIRNEK